MFNLFLKIKPHLTNHLHKEQGLALVTAFLAMILLTLISTVAITGLNTGLKISANYGCHQEAFYAAEAGLSKGKTLLNTGAANSWDDELIASTSQSNTNDYWGDNTALINTASYTITVNDQDATPTVDEDNRVLLTAISGGCRNAVKQIDLFVQNISSNISQKHYGEKNTGNALTETGVVANNNRASF